MINPDPVVTQMAALARVLWHNSLARQKDVAEIGKRVSTPARVVYSIYLLKEARRSREEARWFISEARKWKAGYSGPFPSDDMDGEFAE